MEKKEEKLWLPRMFLIILLVALLNITFFVYQNKEIIDFSNMSFTGFSIKTITTETYENTSSYLRIFFIAQWSVLILFLLIATLKDKSIRIGRKEIKTINFHKNKQETDLDVLYSLIKNKKELRISSISKAFNINKDVAMEWCKILESGNLAVIDYPMFGGPIVKIDDNEIKGSNEINSNKTKIIDNKEQLIKDKIINKKDQEIASIKPEIIKQKTTNQGIIKKRNIFLIYILSILTLGIYFIYWLVSTKNEINKSEAKIPTAWLLILPIINLYWLYKYCNGFAKLKKSNITISLFLLSIISLGILMPIIIQLGLNKLSKQEKTGGKVKNKSPEPKTKNKSKIKTTFKKKNKIKK